MIGFLFVSSFLMDFDETVVGPFGVVDGAALLCVFY